MGALCYCLRRELRKELNKIILSAPLNRWIQNGFFCFCFCLTQNDDGFIINFSFIFCYFWHQIHKFFIIQFRFTVTRIVNDRRMRSFLGKIFENCYSERFKNRFISFLKGMSARCVTVLFFLKPTGDIGMTHCEKKNNKENIWIKRRRKQMCATIYVHSMRTIWWPSFEPVLYPLKCNKRFSNSFVCRFKKLKTYRAKKGE